MNRVAAILGLLVSLAASAWAQPGTGLPPAGFDVLAGVLNFHRVTPMTVEQAIESNDDRLLLVILGRTAPGERLRLANLSRRILAAGGAVLIATDESLQLTAFLRDGAAFQVTGEKIRCNREEFLWANNPLCPFLKPRPLNTARLALASDETALLFTDLDRVAVNLSSRLTAPEELGDDWQRLADLPIGSLTLGEGEALSRTNRLFAAAGSGRFGGNAECRMLLLADAGLLTNQMLAPTAGLPDNDNLALADRIVLWMQGNPNRTRACVVVDGTALTQFDGVPLTMLPPIPPLPLPDPLDPAVQAKLAQAFNETLGKFERNDGFNRLLIGGDETSRPIRLRRLLLSLAVALGIFLLIVGVQRIRSRVHQPQSDLMPAERLDAKVVKLGRIEDRRDGILNSGRATDALPLFLREWFQAAVAEDGGRSGAGGSLPQILISAGGRVKPLGNQIRILWETAQSSDAIPYSRWKELQPMMMEMIRRRQAGEWRFAAEVRS